MSACELEDWLKSEFSESAGWGGDSGETVGHNSGRRIVEILKKNPTKDPSKYDEDDLAHMRKVVSYCKRHLAQESSLKERKNKEELEGSKSTRSLRSEYDLYASTRGRCRRTCALKPVLSCPPAVHLDWGHDPLKY